LTNCHERRGGLFLKSSVEEQVTAGVSREAQFWEDNQVDLSILQLLDNLANRRCIASRICYVNRWRYYGQSIEAKGTHDAPQIFWGLPTRI
jgi:hypothetical protein